MVNWVQVLCGHCEAQIEPEDLVQTCPLCYEPICDECEVVDDTCPQWRNCHDA